MTDRSRLFCLRHGESANVFTHNGRRPDLGTIDTTWMGPSHHVAAEVLGAESITRIYSSNRYPRPATPPTLSPTSSVSRPSRCPNSRVDIGSAEGATDSATRASTANVLRAWVVERDLSRAGRRWRNRHEVVTRVCSALTTIAANHRGQTVAVVGHVASFTVALNELCVLAGTMWGRPCRTPFPFLVEHDGNSWRCVSWPAG
jgi:alpha-ribazole phosphatase/probable phosphoglycerate mutase